MNCRSHQDTLLDAARGVAVDAAASAALAVHLEACGACRARMVREQALSAGLRALARSTREAGPSSAVEAELLQAFDALQPSVQPAGRGARRGRHWMAAAVVVLAAGLAFFWAADRSGSGSRDARLPAVAPESEFVPWPGAASLPAFESGQLVRTELPASALPLLGLVPAGTVTDKAVLADVLVGQDGQARAVRLVKF